MKKRILMIAVLMLLLTVTVTYGWLMIVNQGPVVIDVEPASPQLSVIEDAVNTKKLTPSNYYWLNSQTDEYRYHLVADDIIATLPDPNKTEFYQNILNTYTITIVNTGTNSVPDKVTIKTITATPEGVHVILHIANGQFTGFFNYVNWVRSNPSISVDFIFTEKTV